MTNPHPNRVRQSSGSRETSKGTPEGGPVPPRPPTEVLLDRSASDDPHRTDLPSSAQSTDDSTSPDVASSRAVSFGRRVAPRAPQTPAGPVDVGAELGPEIMNTSIAPPIATGTSASVTTNGISLKYAIARVTVKLGPVRVVFKIARLEHLRPRFFERSIVLTATHQVCGRGSLQVGVRSVVPSFNASSAN